jgi:hypothetical protein
VCPPTAKLANLATSFEVPNIFQDICNMGNLIFLLRLGVPQAILLITAMFGNLHDCFWRFRFDEYGNGEESCHLEAFYGITTYI